MNDLSAVTGPVLVVSPHFDDAALSCAALLDGRGEVDVLTVLGGSPDPPVAGWSEHHMGFPTSRETMAARRSEDERAWEGSGHRVEVLDLLDEDYLPGPRQPADSATLRERVVAWCSRNADGCVAIPAGAGRRQGRIRGRIERLIGPRGGVLQHGDHLFVRDALLAPLLVRANAVLLYEELPYLWGGRADAEVARLAAEHEFEPRALELPVDRELKAARVAHYESQIEQLWEGARLDDPSALPDRERYWILDSRGSTRRTSE